MAAADARGVWIAAAELESGSDTFYPEERPVRRVRVEGFWIDATEVTNDQFAAFVTATGYKTVAERAVAVTGSQGAFASKAGSAVFVQPADVAGLADVAQWWRFVPGADWRHPEGPDSAIAGKGAHPVVHVAREDAVAFAAWRGRSLPTEAQWELAARGGLQGADYVWGDRPYPDGEQRANTWQGIFPLRDDGVDGFRGVAPVGCFAPNGYGLYDMAGNVWEWTSSSYDGQPGFGAIKGGSWLCALDTCGRFRPAARQPGDLGLGTNHIGFRTVLTSD